MAKIPVRRILLTAQREFQREFSKVMASTAIMARGIVQAAAGNDDIIPLAKSDEVQRDVGLLVQRVFVGPDGRRPYGPDGVTPLAPYPAILNDWLAFVTLRVTQQHQAFMKRTMPRDLFEVLRFSFGLVMEISRTEELKARAQVLRIFEPNALAEYEAPHTWIDPNGHRLSDRIWRVSQRTRDRVDALIADGIRTGRSATAIARDLETFIRPDRGNLRTMKPFGRNTSFDAMRLARTEITRAHGQASLVAARMNPYVDQMDWVLSGSHPREDICDELAAGSPYDLNDVPPYPAHPHDLCTLIPRVGPNTREVTNQLREQLETRRQELFITPANAQRFTESLIGDFLTRLALRNQLLKLATAI